MLEFQHNYDEKQIDKILNTINKKTGIELANFEISKQRIKKIEMRRQKQGEFSSIEDILELDGFGVKVLEKFCNSILKVDDASKEGELEQLPLYVKKQQFVSPRLSEETRTSISSCLSFHFDLNRVAWTKLCFESENGSLNVEEWMCHKISSEEKKLNLSDLVQIGLNLITKIPSADVYVIEAAQTPQIAKQQNNVTQMAINLQKSQFLAMLSVLMAARGSNNIESTSEFGDWEDSETQQTLFLLRNFVASRLFKTFIGNERVSAENVIRGLLNQNELQSDRNQIDVPDNLRQFYFDSNKVDREFMGQSLLNGLAFFKLSVLKCPQSIALLSLRS